MARLTKLEEAMGIRKTSRTNEEPIKHFDPDPIDPKDTLAEDANADPLTGAPGAHPVGTGVGAAAAGAAGAIIGSAVPGIGTAIGGAVGAVIGAVAGGYAGKAVAEAVNPTDEDAYWRQEHRNRDYYDETMEYERDYQPAYRMGIESYNIKPGRKWEEAEKELEQSWNTQNTSKLDWERARYAMRDVYERDRVTGEGTRATGTSANTESNT